jgi:hypothetical protein
LSTSEQQFDARERLHYGQSPVALTRAQWAAAVRRGLTHRLGGQRFVIQLDRQRGVRTISPVDLVERRLTA